MHILLKKTANYKGILIITHKEFSFFFKHLVNLSKHYYIFVHNGSINGIKEHPLIKYNMISDSRCIQKNNIPFTSRNFLSKHFNNNSNIKQTNENIKLILQKNNITFPINIDIKNFNFIINTRASEIKKAFELLEYSLQYLDKNENDKICFILLEQDVNNSYYKKIINHWNKNKHKNLCFINTHFISSNNTCYKGFTPEELCNFYKSSKIYIHGCESEGESRTIHEALCCGCMILAKENMKGGGLDHLNNQNSILYNHRNIMEKMMYINNTYNKYTYNHDLFKKLNEEFSVDVFLNFIYKTLSYDSILSYEEFKDKSNTSQLMFTLPGHNLDVPWYIKNKLTADILSNEQYKILLDYI